MTKISRTNSNRRRILASPSVNRDSTNLTTQTENLRTDFASIDPLTRPYVCAQCSQIINERYLLYTEDRLCRRTFWHIHCLRCQSCNVPLADLSIPVCYSKNNQIFCQIDYIKHYGSRPCSACNQIINRNEQIMRTSPNHVYHYSCFTCMKCRKPLVKGDRYVLFDGQPFCEKDNPNKTKPSSTTTKRLNRRGPNKNTRANASVSLTNNA